MQLGCKIFRTDKFSKVVPVFFFFFFLLFLSIEDVKVIASLMIVFGFAVGNLFCVDHLLIQEMIFFLRLIFVVVLPKFHGMIAFVLKAPLKSRNEMKFSGFS